jgi:hypothetical protein
MATFSAGYFSFGGIEMPYLPAFTIADSSNARSNRNAPHPPLQALCARKWLPSPKPGKKSRRGANAALPGTRRRLQDHQGIGQCGRENETVLRGKVVGPIRLTHDAADETDAVAFALYGGHKRLAPTAKADNGGVDHGALRFLGAKCR